jgi:hypothetical protein
MNKKLITALVALTLTLPVTANAAPKLNVKSTSLPAATIAILDSAIDMSQDRIKSRVVYEVCLIEVISNSTARCPNGLSKMEGPGSATLPVSQLSLGGFNHGTLMADQAIQTNPNVNIVFIRIIGQRENGAREYTNEATVFNALQWVYDNQSKFNIQSVAMAQGSHFLGAAGTDYCPKTPVTQSKVQSLNSVGVGVFFPAGNNRDYRRISWPSCLPESIAIGATMPTGSVATYSNYDSLLIDFHARGTTVLYGLNAQKTNFAGTSASVLVAATSWATVKAAKSQLGYTDLYNLLLKTSTPTRNSQIAKANLINIQAALND